ncbi:MAG: YdbL family protein [Alphaproteobacteria bacterium]|nr:YdbL family protein [Alphaproteobacteria bacterium]
MSISRRHLFSIVALAGALLFAPAAFAQSAEQLRASGAAGERWDGLMEARDPGAQAAVNQINQQRQQVYRDRAAKQNVPAQEVGKVYFEQIVRSAPPGTWIKGADGRWVQKR